MATSNQYFNLVQTGKSSWVAVRVHSTPEGDRDASGAEHSQRNTGEELFADSASGQITFTERFPRLTIAMIAFMIFAATVTTEIDFLRGAGFFWQ